MRKPKEAPLEITETPTQPWKKLDIDIFTWTGTKYVTVIDIFSIVASVKPVRAGSGNSTVGSLWTMRILVKGDSGQRTRI